MPRAQRERNHAERQKRKQDGHTSTKMRFNGWIDLFFHSWSFRLTSETVFAVTDPRTIAELLLPSFVLCLSSDKGGLDEGWRVDNVILLPLLRKAYLDTNTQT
jgi:hypothetical protein